MNKLKLTPLQKRRAENAAKIEAAKETVERIAAIPDVVAGTPATPVALLRHKGEAQTLLNLLDAAGRFAAQQKGPYLHVTQACLEFSMRIEQVAKNLPDAPDQG